MKNKIHYHDIPCNIHRRWKSSTLTSVKNIKKVNCKNCLKTIKKLKMENNKSEHASENQYLEGNKEKTGVQLISDERKEQIEKHGYDIEHDKSHSYMTFINAAKAYMFNDIYSWPFDSASFKLNPLVKKNLQKAGAFIAAAIDRLSDQPPHPKEPLEGSEENNWIKAANCFPNAKGNYFLRHPYEDGRMHGWWSYIVPEAIDRQHWIKLNYEWLEEKQHPKADAGISK